MRDIMKYRGRLFLAISIIGILSSVILPGVNAEIFDIGEEVDSDLEMYKFHAFTSGAYIRADEHEVNLSHLIFDGNLSTGVDQNVIDNLLSFRLMFIYPLFVNNITIKPKFGNGSSNYSLSVLIYSSSFSPEISGGEEKFLQINGFINGVSLDIYPNGTDQFYFNDVIINYTPGPTNLTGVITAINILTNTVNSLQNQINNLNQQIDTMNNTINSLNQNQLQILENITTLQSNYNQLNNSLMDLFYEIENLNITTNENITQLKDDLTSIDSNINDIYQSLDDLNTNVTELSEIQNLINQTTQDILYLNENITDIKNTMPSEYDDAALMSRVFQLESDNAALSNQIQNLTEEMDNLKDDKDETDDFVPLGAFVLGILGILIAIMAVILATRKTEPKKPGAEIDELEEDEEKVNEEDSGN